MEIEDKLVELEKKIDQMMVYLATLDLNVKLILSRFNKDSLQKSVSATETQKPKEEKPSSKKKANNTSVSIQQNLHYKRIPADKNNGVALAKVVIKSIDGQDVKIPSRIMTDSQGQWRVTLPFGKYAVTIIKAAASKEKPVIETNFELDLNEETANPLKLDSLSF